MTINGKMVEAALGMLARFVPSEEYSKIAGAINDLVAQGRAIEARAAKIEEACGKIETLVGRVDFLETVLRNNVEGANAAFSEADWWQKEQIGKALGPAVPGSLDREMETKGYYRDERGLWIRVIHEH